MFGEHYSLFHPLVSSDCQQTLKVIRIACLFGINLLSGNGSRFAGPFAQINEFAPIGTKRSESIVAVPGVGFTADGAVDVLLIHGHIWFGSGAAVCNKRRATFKYQNVLCW